MFVVLSLCLMSAFLARPLQLAATLPRLHGPGRRLQQIVRMSGCDALNGQGTFRTKVGMVQMTSVNDRDVNFKHNEKMVRQAAAEGCSIVFFPECFSFIGAKPGEAQAAAEELSGPTVARYKELAKSNNVWLSLGGYQEKEPAHSEGKIYNTHLIINAAGELVTSYRKIHLYDVPMVNLVESRQALPGDQLVACDSPAGRLGVTICYDLRFPEVYQKLTFLHGAQVLLVPSAFAMKTGAAHWETLLRSRAIETQCYVIAAAQVGRHNEDGNRRESYGHSLAIDPWGNILVDMGTTRGLSVIEIDSELIQSTRNNMPMDKHRRYDIYGDGPHASGGDGPTSAKQQRTGQDDKEMFFG
eukprot:TRINITY_DN82668_c0_g1_i1.p1 TRINITY_DN82668_c0_g1~~TRINITY_DN82668_c0_g1_i1.p1  ORF type:complete len:356 (-),score=67.63 TRINITY_DN82668_c0_g1_i1:150-1217(-)